MKRAGIQRPDGTERPETRLVEDGDGQVFVVELRPRFVTIRPYRARGGAVTLTWAAIYRQGQLAEARAAEAAKGNGRRKVKRGLLSFGR